MIGPDPDLTARLVQVREMHEAAEALERDTIREALRRADWWVARAAHLLGWVHGTLQGVLAPGRRHAVLGAEVAAERHLRGRRPGRPRLPLPERMG